MVSAEEYPQGVFTKGNPLWYHLRMELKDALRKAAGDAGWTATQIGAAAGATEWSARNWLAGKSHPSFPKLKALRAKLPGFAALMDGDLKASA